MNTLNDTARSLRFEDGFIVISMRSGADMRFPVADNPRLAGATPAQLNLIELSPFGLHWPDLDEDLSFQGIAQGNHGQVSTRRAGELAP